MRRFLRLACLFRRYTPQWAPLEPQTPEQAAQWLAMVATADVWTAAPADTRRAA